MNLRRIAAGAAVLGLLALTAGAGSATAAGSTGPEVTKTKTVTREMQDDDGDHEVDGIKVTTVDERTVTVTASKTHDLRGRESVHIAWSGARPSAGVAGETGNPATFLKTEYPVVVLQCRGIDDSTGQISPETCWTTSFLPRSMGGNLNVAGVNSYMHDLYATEPERAVSVPSAQEWAKDCPGVEPPGSGSDAGRRIPFVAADSKATTYWNCSPTDVAPEMSTSGALPPNERVEPTGMDGTGFTDFEVRSVAENQSLGCSQEVACSIVVIPIMGISCRDADAGCRKTGANDPGSPFVASSDSAVVGKQWASASNWRNRISIPLSFAPSANLCAVSDQRRPLQLYGTQLVVQAASQWAPAYCTRADRFKLQVNDQPEGTAFRNLSQGYGNGVVATYPSSTGSSVPLGFAPIAVTGFAIAFNVDLPNNGGPLEQLKLSPRLLVKLMTASYPGFVPTPGVLDDRPDLVHNPLALQLDPEFQELNPSLVYDGQSWLDNVDVSFASLLMLSVPSDTLRALTEYIASDSEAMAFLHGEPDPWGMTVNSNYRDIAMPRSDWPLLDSWLRPSANVCDVERPYGWFNRIMAPVSSLSKISQDMLAGTPETLVAYDKDYVTNVCVFSRSPQQFAPTRHMLGLVALADARLYGLRTAQLRTAGTGATATFVGADDSSMNAAVATARQVGPGEPFLIDQVALHDHPDAYPGTMVLHVAVPLAQADATVSAKMAQFIKIATSEGQVSGSGVGQLAPGYVPITSQGPTAALYTSAQVVATAVAAQAGAVPGDPTQPSDDSDGVGVDTSTTGTPVAAAPPVTAPVPVTAPDAGPPVDTSVTVQGEPAPAPSETASATATATTNAPVVSGPMRAAVPAALGIALVAGISAPLIRRYSTRRGPL